MTDGTVGWAAHRAAADDLARQLRGIPAEQPVRLAKRTSNLFRPRTAIGTPGLDVSRLGGVIEVDRAARTAQVQGMCTYESLVDATLAHGLMPDPAGSGFVLACAPDAEAAIYSQTATSTPYLDISRIELPVRIIRARQRPETGTFDMSYSPTAPDLVRRFANATDECLQEYSHYLPMEAPQLVAEYIQSIVC